MSRSAVAGLRGGFAVAWALAWGAVVPGAHSAPALYSGSGGWAAVTGLPESAPPAAGPWNFTEGVWIGRLPEGATKLEWGEGGGMQIAEAQTPPPGSSPLPNTRNAFGPCVVRSLSVRYDSVVRSRRWSLVFAGDDENPDFEPLALPDRRSVGLALELEDVVSGQRWPLRPERRAREGGRFSGRNDPRFYGGTVDDGDVDWTLIAVPRENGRVLLQGQIMLLKSDSRLFRLRLFVRTGAIGEPLLGQESPPVLLSVRGEEAFALYPDLAEPRRYRAAKGLPDAAGLEFDLAVTKATGNFPRRATFALEVEAWKTADPETARQEAVAKLARAGGGVAVPEAVLRAGLAAVPTYDPVAMRLIHPGGFRDRTDAVNYLMLRASGLFRDFDWAASAFTCAAQDAQGEPQMELAGDVATLAVNPDPDLEAMLEWGQNRGLTLLERIRGSGAPAVRIVAGTLPGRLDHGARALYLCDYPAVWDAGTAIPGVDLDHAEAEWISSLSCVLRTSGTCLLIEDGGPLAPFTTYYADALVCASAEPDEMRRQRALAGPRPVLWTAAEPGADAAALARDLGFVRFGKIEEN